jgi:tetratricopeptide (TPR) repeat protein
LHIALTQNIIFTMKCPVCRAPYRSASASFAASPFASEANPASRSQLCRRCGVDLSSLIQLHDQAIWHHRQAIQAFKVADYEAAAVSNNQAIAFWSSNADFYGFAGQLWALQGEFPQAIAAWKKAQQLDPQQTIAHAGLHYLTSSPKADLEF